MAIQTITYGDKSYLNELPDIPATNKVQDVDMNEIKSVVNNNANELITEIELFSNPSGSLNVTLNDSSANYDYLYIETIALQYVDNIKNDSFIINNPNGKDITRTYSFYNMTNNQIYVVCPIIYINNTSITISNNQAGTVGATNSYVGLGNCIGITKVIGYKRGE